MLKRYLRDVQVDWRRFDVRHLLASQKATLRTVLQRLALDSRDEEPEDAEGVTP